LAGSVPGRRPHCPGGGAIRPVPALAFTLDRVTLRGFKDHPHAVRMLAGAWLYVIWHCWHNGVARLRFAIS
jgi:hypothetical protein